MRTIVIATRQSPLALWQAEFVKQQLLISNPSLSISLLKTNTIGDKRQDVSLAEIGGKNLFIKELQSVVIDGIADIAVHSLKDLSVKQHPDLCLAAVCEREDPRDAFVSNHYPNIDSLPQSAVVGTASPRRQAQLAQWRPDLTIKLLRGNVQTRLSKLDNNEFDAIILACAGLIRLDLAHRITESLDPKRFIPAIAQGALGVECRQHDEEMKQLLTPLNHHETALCVAAERAVNIKLGGDCFTPIAAHATLVDENSLALAGFVGSIDGGACVRSSLSGDLDQAEGLGLEVANDLLAQGASTIISKKDI